MNKEDTAVDFALWLHQFYVSVDNRGWVSKYPQARNVKVMFTRDLYLKYLNIRKEQSKSLKP